MSLSETDYSRMQTAVNVERRDHILTGQQLRIARDDVSRLRHALRSAADDFDLVQERIADRQHERAKATAFQGAKEARAILARAIDAAIPTPPLRTRPTLPQALCLAFIAALTVAGVYSGFEGLFSWW